MNRFSEDKINICSDPVLRDRLKDKGIKSEVFDNILSENEKITMLESLDEFISMWFITRDGRDCTEYRNVSIGAAIHDEMMTIFHLLIHFIFIIDKLGTEKIITFYHSNSCLMPEPIIDFLRRFKVAITLVDERYPWLSYKEQFNKQARANFSRISFKIDKDQNLTMRSKLGEIKLALREKLSKLFFWVFSSKTGKNMYLHVHRSLVYFYGSCLEGKKGFNIYITDTTPLKAKTDKKRLNIFKDIYRIFKLGCKRVAIDSLRCPFYYKWYCNYEKEVDYQKLIGNFDRELSKKKIDCLKVDNGALLDYFREKFRELYLMHLVEFMKLIDFYYEKFSRLKVDSCLQEMCHPFQAQVLANTNTVCYILPSNHILHNQYFTPFFFKKIRHFVKPIAFSDLDAERFEKLGFSRENIQISGSRFLEHWQSKIRPFHKLDSLNGKKILILAPSIIALDAFRYQVQGEKLYSFFSDIFEVLSDLRVSSVTIRPHPGANISRNQFGYNDNDILKYLINKINNEEKHFQVIFSNSYYHNLEEDISDNDIVIANLSGAIFEVLILGKDYIYFDHTITPHYGSKDWSIFNEGTIKKLKTKEELRNYLINYCPSDLESLRERLLGNIFLVCNNDRIPDTCSILG